MILSKDRTLPLRLQAGGVVKSFPKLPSLNKTNIGQNDIRNLLSTNKPAKKHTLF